MKILKEDTKKINNFYNKRLKSYGTYSPKSLSWNDEFSQYCRYKILAEIGNLKNKIILDVGCGLGDFYFYLKNRFQTFSYTGIDIIPEMIKNARKKYPETKFICINFENFNDKQFDYTFASGTFSQKISNHLEIYTSMIKKMYTISKTGAAFNMLNKNFHLDNETSASYYPEEIMKICETFAKKVQLIQGYLPHDFTIYLFH